MRGSHGPVLLLLLLFNKRLVFAGRGVVGGGFFYCRLLHSHTHLERVLFLEGLDMGVLKIYWLILWLSNEFYSWGVGILLKVMLVANIA